MSRTDQGLDRGQGLDHGLHPTLAELQARARAFVDGWLIPYEETAERNGGRIPEEIRTGIIEAAKEVGLNGGRHAKEHGGQGWSASEWFLVQEQYGRSTNALHWWVPDGYNVLEAGSPEQIERYLVPSIDGRILISYAVTEELAGSAVSTVA